MTSEEKVSLQKKQDVYTGLLYVAYTAKHYIDDKKTLKLLSKLLQREADKLKKSVYPIEENDLANMTQLLGNLRKCIDKLAKARKTDDFNNGKAQLQEIIDVLQRETDKIRNAAKTIIETVSEKARDVGHKISAAVEKGIENIKKNIAERNSK